ncbi:MAG: UDP-N-acetylglucosamine 2-epimerase [Fibrobacteres bacterium]|nr:UDP-N-acetylglucosamine 2-epimerase [Fibrobacterota bacterium]
MFKVILVCGARPNFMKIAPVLAAIRASGRIQPYLVHTGQHYDEKMSQSFFDVLRIPRPDVDLGVGSGSHAEQTARIMVEFEKVCIREKPEMVLVVGDVNSTLACAIVAKKLWVPVAHVEAGLRSGDMRMPEEINRIVTDSISDLFFTTEPEGNENLLRFGAPKDRVHYVGNVMIDSLLQNREAAEKIPVLEEMKVESGKYCLLTMHRPSNVDDPKVLGPLLDAFAKIQERLKIVFPAHPRTMSMIEKFGFSEKIAKMPNVVFCPPLDYHRTLKLNAHSRFVMTDSGGLQEETTALGIPCLTIRENTERPVTVTTGTNEVVGTSPEKLLAAVEVILAGKWKKGGIPEGWDGKASERIVAILEAFLERSR